MFTKLNIENFKSLHNVELPLGKITVLTGANNSGKSSFIYSLLALKNTVSNPNQSIDACLTLPFINLGGFKETVFFKNESENISIESFFKESEIEVSYKLSIGKITSYLEMNAIKPYKFSCKIDIAFPYPANKIVEFEYDNGDINVIYNWNGIIGNVLEVKTSRSIINPNDTKEIKKINELTLIFKRLFLLPINEFSKIDFVPLRRGFTQPYYNPVPLGALISTEEEIASLLGNDRDLAGKVTFYLEKIVERSFSIYSPPGIATIYLQTMDKKNGFTSDLVNEGLGTNQLVTILAKIMQKNNKFICIDEPEIHLHPSIIDKLVSVLIEMAEHEDKQFLVSTHSEHFINSLLKNITEGNLKNEEAKIYYLEKTRRETKTEYQEINNDGQIKGGLKNFYKIELENLKTLFKITDL
jgi:predicted ATPase